MKTRYISILLLAAMVSGCAIFGGGKPKYSDVYDEFSDEGQYTMPKQKFGKSFWSVEISQAKGMDGIVDNLLSESLVGLTALATNEDRGDVMVWMDVDNDVYNRIKSNLPMTELGTYTAWELVAKPEIKQLISGYVVYDTTNQESINVATIASHVYNGFMVAKHQMQKADAAGYEMVYDASTKSLADAWSEFRDKCNNNAMVLMPCRSSNQRSTAISGRLMCVNLNKVSYHPEKGSNKDLLIEMMMWLRPLSPVMGWEQGVGEDSFVGLVSKTGNLMIPYDWTVNTPLMSANYENRQSGLANVLNPNSINFGDAEHYMSFYMSDGDNVQWMINGFGDQYYYGSPLATQTKMTFGYPVANLSMISPDQNSHLLSKQQADVSIMESLGGGYVYADNFAELKDRKEILDQASKSIAAHMRQHRNNVLALVCDDVVSERSKEAYQSFISNNDRLVGIVVIQYTPYAGGNGEIMWFKNAAGYDIPVVTVRYSVWNYGVGNNGSNEGTPTYIASKYNQLAQQDQSTFSVTSIHAWSRFSQCDDPNDLTAENNAGDIHGVESAALCMDRLASNIKVVNVEELLWQLRMKTYPEQTKKILKSYN